MKQPTAPFLVIREGAAFWVEEDGDAVAATRSALRDGCFAAALCYDETGGLWPVIEARPGPPSIRQRLSPWSRIPVELEFGGRRRATLDEIVALLAEVLDSSDEFCDHLEVDPEALRRRLARALTPGELIEAARGA